MCISTPPNFGKKKSETIHIFNFLLLILNNLSIIIYKFLSRTIWIDKYNKKYYL